jgi:very-short-patch-repair endonuclease
MSAEAIGERLQFLQAAPSSRPSGEGQGGVRRASADYRAPPLAPEPNEQRPWGRPEATAAVNTARMLRKRMTRQEIKVWLGLRALHEQGFHFRRQVPIASFIVDFACLRAGLVVEIDGGQHSHGAHAKRDKTRDAALAKAGFRVLRFWNSDVDFDPTAVIDTVFAHLTDKAATRPTPPLPLP